MAANYMQSLRVSTAHQTRQETAAIVQIRQRLLWALGIWKGTWSKGRGILCWWTWRIQRLNQPWVSRDVASSHWLWTLGSVQWYGKLDAQGQLLSHLWLKKNLVLSASDSWFQTEGYILSPWCSTSLSKIWNSILCLFKWKQWTTNTSVLSFSKGTAKPSLIKYNEC